MKLLHIAIIICVCCLPQISAQTSFNQIIWEIVENNPDLKATRASIDAMSAQEQTTLNLSDPEIEFSHKWGPREAGNKTELGISQSLLLMPRSAY